MFAIELFYENVDFKRFTSIIFIERTNQNILADLVTRFTAFVAAVLFTAVTTFAVILI